MGLYFLAVYLGGFALLAVAVLWCVPGLRVTYINVLLFIPGAALGMMAFTKALFWGLEKALGVATVNSVLGRWPIFAFAPFVIGAILGGAMLVWLKNRLVKHSTRGNS